MNFSIFFFKKIRKILIRPELGFGKKTQKNHNPPWYLEFLCVFFVSDFWGVFFPHARFLAIFQKISRAGKKTPKKLEVIRKIQNLPEELAILRFQFGVFFSRTRDFWDVKIAIFRLSNGGFFSRTRDLSKFGKISRAGKKKPKMVIKKNPHLGGFYPAHPVYIYKGCGKKKTPPWFFFFATLFWVKS